jgi:biotin carboxylase
MFNVLYGRNVLLDSSNCHTLFPPNCAFLESFESKIKSKEIADKLEIKVAKQVSLLHNENEEENINQAECNRGFCCNVEILNE